MFGDFGSAASGGTHVGNRIAHVDVLGTKVAAINLGSAVDQLIAWSQHNRRGRYVCVTGVHGVMESLRRRDVARAHHFAAACVPDGMPMTWVGRVHGHRGMDRVYGPDLMLRVLELSARLGLTHYFFGGTEGVADDLKEKMEARFPGLEVVGTWCPPFRPLQPEERSRLVEEVNRLEPDIFWVGLSTPKQELFMCEYSEILTTNLMVGVGAAFDFHTGRVRQAPRWMMRSGLEWLFRLCLEPRRLGPRYLRNNPAFMWHIFLQLTGLRNYQSFEENRRAN